MGEIPLSLLTSAGGEGAEVIFALRNNDTLSKNILNEFSNNGFPVRKIYQRQLPNNPGKDYYFIHRDTKDLEPLIIEYGFIDNQRDAKRISESYKEYAESVIKAVLETKGLKYFPPQKRTEYIVQRGDTLWSIAKKLDTTVDNLKNINNLNNNFIYINQKLKVPTFEVVEDVNTTYVVKKGDTLYSISKQNNISIDELKNYNKLDNEYLVEGQLILIPKTSTIKNKEDNQESIIQDNIIYVVNPGDTLYSISKKNNVSVNDIIDINNLPNDNIHTGMKLVIPNSSYVEIYEVKKGDSLWGLSKRLNITIEDIKRLNNLDRDYIIEGEKLQIKRNII